MAQVITFLPSLWETWVELLILAVVVIWGMNLWMGRTLELSLSLICLSASQINRSHKLVYLISSQLELEDR